MIILVSEKIEPWLKYIWGEFSRIQGLQDKSLLLDMSEYHARLKWDSKFVIEQGSKQNVAGSLFVADLLYNAFVHLSRLEEWNAEKNGTLIGSYASRHPQRDLLVWHIPLVNNLFAELEKKIKEAFPSVQFENGDKPKIELSHDLDYIEKTLQLRLKQTAFGIYKTSKLLSDPMSMARELLRTGKFFFSNPSYWCFEYWQKLERQFNKRSVFYVYAKVAPKNVKTWLLDPSYDLSRNIKLQLKLKELVAEGFEIGLHGSYESACNETLLIQEKEILESVLGHAVTKTRQHWLRYQENTTPYAHDKLFKFDSTLGWNDSMGFRAGCASRYRPYDHLNQRPFDFYETPLVLMDSTVYDYNSDRVVETESRANALLQNLKSIKNAHVSVCWHQRVCSEDYGWDGFYRSLVIEGIRS